MGVENLQKWTPLIKEAFLQSFRVAKFFCAIHITNTYVCTFAMTRGPSMLPTFNLTGDFVLAERLSTRFGKVVPGDVVLVRSPENPRKIISKRVVGVAGDTVKFVADPKNSEKEDTIVVPKGHVWIEGDFKYNTTDSRKFGPVPYGLVQGRIIWIVWPPEDFGSVRREVK
ncbi:PREDICTED: mitochondrial inner membrane protease subunit 1-like [Ipomoea nil]|uniref:mitochondrial inner membrane protease subunit 1-like n=1 Tax=Ipomoea nil TaxID=35883 RepID=UPI0009012003|nr:PREDICTED: mitochondrial inner membrane protease subunit 1-like [Ipomoea nil]XP_019169807.1 PREDICTED: mitochondrial inner membrane protease subunit 1-like [Ipomoea nil]XP_019169808.1 PREDICTED: mitochondrial inner membrane protease subunit 1-like [Ipomoea nil]XP_019169809.1 PREDICTED: mitochondrial inner membrane protease subunit 1-like [Ipomoea nil]